MRLKQPSVLPGFGLTMGLTMTYLSLLVLIPLAAVPEVGHHQLVAVLRHGDGSQPSWPRTN